MSMRRASSLTHNVVYNIAGFAAPMAVTFMTVPAYLRAVGEARYGLLSLIWLLFGYFGLFDFGLSRATANRLAQLKETGPEERADVFHTAVAMNAFLGLVVGVVFYVSAGPLLALLSGGSQQLQSELPSSLLSLAAFFPLSMIGGVFIGSLEAEERFLTINIQQIVGAVLLQCLPLFAVLAYGPDIGIAVLGALAARLIMVVISGVSAARSFAACRKRARSDLAYPLLKYGGWVAVTNLISPLLASLDRFFIGWLLGAASVAYYAIPFSLASKVAVVPGSLTRAMFPRLSRLNRDEAHFLAQRAIVTLSIVMALICAPTVLLTHFGLALWIGPEFATKASVVAQIFLVGTWVNSIGYVPYSFLQAQGRPDVVAKFHALEFAPFVALLWFGLKLWGLEGAALAWLFRVLADTGLLLWASGFSLKNLSKMLPAAAAVAAAWGAVAFSDLGQLANLALACVLSASLLCWWVATDPDLRNWIARRAESLWSPGPPTSSATQSGPIDNG